MLIYFVSALKKSKKKRPGIYTRTFFINVGIRLFVLNAFSKNNDLIV
ncbi:MAG: hypothetical protein JWR38_2478 [Mucilaginibacter sp.]|nr:hypothetical protein [Mucilaginibacter sp.]